MKVRPELVAFGVADQVSVDEGGVVGGGEHLQPEQVHELVDAKRQQGVEVTFFDGRNAMEAQIGRFTDAVVPDTETTRDFVSELDSGKYDHLKDQPVITYCTGGIRCEVLFGADEGSRLRRGLPARRRHREVRPDLRRLRLLGG